MSNADPKEWFSIGVLSSECQRRLQVTPTKFGRGWQESSHPFESTIQWRPIVVWSLPVNPKRKNSWIFALSYQVNLDLGEHVERWRRQSKHLTKLGFRLTLVHFLKIRTCFDVTLVCEDDSKQLPLKRPLNALCAKKLTYTDGQTAPERLFTCYVLIVEDSGCICGATACIWRWNYKARRNWGSISASIR